MTDYIIIPIALLVVAFCFIGVLLAWAKWGDKTESREEYLRQNGRSHGNFHTKPLVKRPVNIKPPNPSRVYAK